MKMINKGLDQIRREESSGKKVLKGTRFLFLKNNGKLNDKEKQKLEEISMNTALKRTVQAYQYKELFRELYKSETTEEFETKLKNGQQVLCTLN